MYSHNMVGSDDLAASKTFYDAIFTAVGAEEGVADPVKPRVRYSHKDSVFIVTKPLNGEPASVANGNTIGFIMDSPEQCDAWHAAGVAAGGTACEDPPGPRDFGGRMLYLAYLRDPTGHKLCALYPMG
jgi:catechol 2,3-dioxygenase-like lactoylglutathione lyase family enzyme